jgi:hypothetical protein
MFFSLKYTIVLQVFSLLYAANSAVCKHQGSGNFQLLLFVSIKSIGLA